MKKKTALIFGISGQDGSYLAHLLLKKKYNVIGAVTQIGILGCDTNNWNDKLLNKNPFFMATSSKPGSF